MSLLASEPAADVAAFNDALDGFLRSTRRARGRFNREPEIPELSLSQFHLLEPLAGADGPVCVSNLAEGACVSAPSATRMLDGLERRGLVGRVRGADDRRLVHIVLTQAGRALVEAKAVAITERRRAVFERLTPAERRAAAGLLESLAAAIEEIH